MGTLAVSPANRSIQATFRRILGERAIRTAFQPVVDLASGATVGYEALIRGPEDSELSDADALIATAHHAGRLVEFDWAARASACQTAMDADLSPGSLLFLNIEPIALDSECPADLWPAIERGFSRFRVALEVTERSMDRDPGTLLDGIERQRPLVAGIAIDDCGSEPATLSMLPLVAPSIIKIDAGIVQTQPDSQVARVLCAIHEEVEHTNAVLVAEGVENFEYRDRALSYGARFGQGYLYSRPRDLRVGERAEGGFVAIERDAPLMIDSPFDALGHRRISRADEGLLRVLMRDAHTCSGVGAPALHVVLLPRAELLDDQEIARLSRMARDGTFCAVLGPGVPANPADGVRGIGMRRSRPPTDQWAAITIGSCGSAAVLARRLPGDEGGWEYGITHDRPRTIAAARTLIRLLGAAEPDRMAAAVGDG